MATARAAKPDDKETKPKNGRGRPRTRGGDPPAELIDDGEGISTAEAAVLVSPGATLDANEALEFFDLLRAYAESEWTTGGLIAYLYRTAPIIDRARQGQEYNLQKFTRAFDVDEIMKAAYGGSGGYKVLLRRFNSKTRHTDAIRDHYFRILNYEYPPRIPAGDWLDSEANREWQWAKPQLEAIARAEAAKGQPNGQPAAADDKVIALVRELLPGARKDEASSIAAEVVREIQRDQPKTAAGLEAIVLKLLEQKSGNGDGDHYRAELAESRRFQNELLLKLTEKNNAPPAAAPRSLLAELKELAEAKDVLGNIFGRANGKTIMEKLDWPEVGVRIGEKLIDAAGPVMQAIAMRSGVKQPAARAAAVAAGTPAAAAATPDIETAEEVQEMIANISKQFGPMFDEVTPFLSNYFLRGVSGMEFRDWLIQEYGRRSYDGLRQLHPQTIADVIELRKTEAPTDSLRAQLAQLTPKPKLLEFIGEFLSDEPSEFSADDEPGGEVEQSAPGLPAAGAARTGGGF